MRRQGNLTHPHFQEELPPLNQLACLNKKTIEKVCQSPDPQEYRPKTRGRVTFNAPKVASTPVYLDDDFETNLNKSIAVIESMEMLNDSMSLLENEQKNKLAGLVSCCKFFTTS